MSSTNADPKCACYNAKLVLTDSIFVSVLSGGENRGHNVHCTDGFPFQIRSLWDHRYQSASLKCYGLVGYNCFQLTGSTIKELETYHQASTRATLSHISTAHLLALFDRSWHQTSLQVNVEYVFCSLNTYILKAAVLFFAIGI